MIRGGGAHLKKNLAIHTHKIIAINTRLYVLFYSNTCWNPGFRGIMHLHKSKGAPCPLGPSGLAVFRGRGRGRPVGGGGMSCAAPGPALALDATGWG